MYYHASSNGNIKCLEPRVSNDGESLVYLSSKRENVLVYLSNSIEKFCKETNYECDHYTKWGPYGFGSDGILELEEYYPNALEETYKGVSGYIYTINSGDYEKSLKIPHVYTSKSNVLIDSVEYVEDAYDEIIKASDLGLIRIVYYDEFISKKKDWLIDIINREYNDPNSTDEYKYFLKNKFSFLEVDHE